MEKSLEDLSVQSGKRLLAFKRRNFRENVRRRTGYTKAAAEGYDAHHTLPVKFENAFNKAGVNIHNPVLGHWWCSSAHRSAASAFNAEWQAWLRTRRDDITKSKVWRERIEAQRLKMVSTDKWARTYQCR